MKKKTNNNPDVRQSNKFKEFIDTLLHQKTKKQLLIFGSSAVLLVTVVIAVSLSRNISAAVQPPVSDQLAASAADQTNITGTETSMSALPTAAPTSTPVPSPTPTPDPTLRQGDENVRVQALQERLMELNYLDLDESTQLYGPATEYAVELFQRQHNLTQDGVAGLTTLDLLNSDQAQKYTLLKGTSGSDVDSLQRQLIDLGYLDKATGYYGTETVTAVTAFQERNGLSVDGKTGEQTLALIYSPDAVESATKAKEAVRKANIDTFLEVAEAQLGDPYISGNVGPKSFDCSGLVYYCLKEAGSSRGRYNAAGYSQVSDWEKITSMSDLQVGDLLFFHTNGKSVGHTGIYIGDGMMIDASSSNAKVVKRSCFTSYWENHFVCGRRPW